MKNSRQYTQLIATNLIERFKEYEENPPPIIGFSISRLEYLIHLILSHKQKKHKGSWSVLHMPFMRNIVPKADEYLKFLNAEGVIEWKNYSAGRNSRLYRLVDEGVVEFRTITDQKLIRRIEESRKNISRRNSKKYPQLNQWLNKVEIEWENAIETIEKESLKSDKPAGWRTFALGSVERIRAGEIFISVNDTNFRLDSNFTNLPKELLKHITINGHHLIEMDISNSQPFFSACLFNPTPDVEQVMKNYLGSRFIMVIKSLYISQFDDVKRYCSLVTSGKFYEHMMGKFREYNIPYRDRGDVKTQLFIVFFGKCNADKFNPGAKLFKQEFPNVFKLFEMIKKPKSNRLAILLQRIEAYVILDRVAKRISDEFPTMPFLTKHDSILPFKLTILTPGITNQVRQIMVDTIKEVTGIIPQGRMKKFI